MTVENLMSNFLKVVTLKVVTLNYVEVLIIGYFQTKSPSPPPGNVGVHLHMGWVEEGGRLNTPSPPWKSGYTSRPGMGRGGGD